MEENDLADLVKMCRTTAKMSQGELAKGLRMERSNVSRFENGNAIPNAIVIKKIGKLTNCEELITSYYASNECWRNIFGLKAFRAAVENARSLTGMIM